MIDSDRKKGGTAAAQKKTSSASGGKKSGRSSSSAGKSSSAKKGAAKSGSKRTSSSAPSVMKKSSGSRLRDEVTAVLLAALGIFLAFALLTNAAGTFGLVLARLLKGMFGFGAYILPFYVILCAILLLANRMAHINGRSTFLLLLVYLDIVTAHSVLFDAVEAQTFGLSYLKSMYTLGISLDSAGVVGMSIGWLVVRGIGKTGLLIACAAILLISLMLLLNSPMSGIVDRRREKKYRAAMERAAEREAEEAAARERQEMQMQIRQAESDDSLHNRGRRRGRKRRKVLPQTDPFHRKAPAVQEKEERMPSGISGYEAPTCFRGKLPLTANGLL